MMKHIPLHAKVECTDGEAGESTNVISDPVTRRLTYVVVREKHGEKKERLVPLDRVEKTTSKLIRLNISLEELAALEPFSTRQFMETVESAEGSYALPYAVLEATPAMVEYEHIPPGQLSIHRGTDVEATDGRIGDIDEFAIDPKNGEITHLILREGHLWGKKELALPVSAIDRVFDGVVYLKIDKEAVEKLPTIPVRHAEDTEIELVVVAFDKPEGAPEARDFLKQLERSKSLAALRNVAVLVKDEKGQTSIKESEDVDPKHGAIFGAITGGLVGLLAGPIGAIVGAAAGAAARGAAPKPNDNGV